MNDFLSWSHIASGLSGIILLLIGFLIDRAGKQGDKMDNLLEKMSSIMTYEDCRLERHACPVNTLTRDIKEERRISWDRYERDVKDFREVFYNHSHTELGSDSSVKIK